MERPQGSFPSPSLKSFPDNPSQKELKVHQQPTMMQDYTETKYRAAVLQEET